MSLYSLGNIWFVLFLQLAWFIHVLFVICCVYFGVVGGVWFVLLLLCWCVLGGFEDPGFGDGDAVGEVGFVDEGDDGDVGVGLFPEVADADGGGGLVLVGFFGGGPVVSSE